MTARAAERAAAVRRGAGCFPDLARGVVEVTGGDRRRWLNGMLSADVGALPAGGGSYALMLSPQGRILADFQVIERGDRFWLDTAADRVQDAITRLSRYVIADDVALADASHRFARIGIEGRAAPDVLSALCGGVMPAMAPDGCADVEVAAHAVAIAAFGWSGEPAYQLFAPAAARAPVLAAIARAGGDALVAGDADVLEVLRIEAGIPRMGTELGEDVLPAEAGLVERAVSLTKGCFTGQEIVARMYSRGQPSHRLVGVRSADAPPPIGPLAMAGKPVGEVTSACMSRAGAIGLAFVRPPHDAPGTELWAGDRRVQVAALPLVPAGGIEGAGQHVAPGRGATSPR